MMPSVSVHIFPAVDPSQTEFVLTGWHSQWLSPLPDVHGNVWARYGEGLCHPGQPGQGVQHLHGGGVWEALSLREEVWDPVQLHPHVLPVLHPPVEVCQAVWEHHHQVSAGTWEGLGLLTGESGAAGGNRAQQSLLQVLARPRTWLGELPARAAGCTGCPLVPLIPQPCMRSLASGSSALSDCVGRADSGTAGTLHWSAPGIDLCAKPRTPIFFLCMCLIRGFFPKLQVNVPLTMLLSVSVNAFTF